MSRANSMVRLSAAALTMTALTACGSGTPKAVGPQSSSKAAPPPTSVPAEPPGGYDIGRIADLAGQLPPGFTVTQIPRTTLTKEQADDIAGMSKQFAFTFDPPQCNSVLKPAGVEAGAVSQGVMAQGPQQLTIIAVQATHPLPDTAAAGGCSHVAFTSKDNARGTADVLPGPAIDGASTSSVKVHLDFATPGFSKSIDRLTYVAALSDRTAVAVDGESDTRLLEGLLVKAVAALRQK